MKVRILKALLCITIRQIKRRILKCRGWGDEMNFYVLIEI